MALQSITELDSHSSFYNILVFVCLCLCLSHVFVFSIFTKYFHGIFPKAATFTATQYMQITKVSTKASRDGGGWRLVDLWSVSVTQNIFTYSPA